MDFLRLMGKGKRCWKHVKTRKDRDELKEFKELFDRNFVSNYGGKGIPEILHFVWIGPNEYSTQARKYLESFLQWHPSWRVVFWSDRIHANLPDRVEQRLIDKSVLGMYERFYNDSDNFGEKSDLVRLLALNEMGGVYIDHDMECRSSFEKIHRDYPFYTGLMTPKHPIMNSVATVRNSIIGALPHHPIIQRALELTERNWDHAKQEYPGRDAQSIKGRVTLRGFAAFHQAVLEAVRQKDFAGIVFPAGCFNEIEKDFGVLAKEDMLGSWYTEGMSHHEEYLKGRLHRLMKRLHLFMALVGVMVVALGGFVIWKEVERKWSKKSRKVSSYHPMDTSLIKEEKKFAIIIPSYNNEVYVERNLQSVLSQDYHNYRVIYIDDASTDRTYEIAHKMVANSPQVELIHNAINQKALCNIYHAVQQLADDEIVILLDGDDWLARTDVLKELNRYYNDPHVWMTYGQYTTYPKYELGGAREPRIKKASYRDSSTPTHWFFTHLRTFYAGLFKKIKQEDLLYQGKFFSSAWDLAIFLPMLEMAGKHAVYIPTVLYVYNRETPLNDDKVRLEEQLMLNRYIRSLPPYSKL